MSKQQLREELNSPKATRALRDGKNSFFGQLVLEKIDVNLEILLKRFDSMRITDTYTDRAAAIQGGRRSMLELKKWIEQ